MGLAERIQSETRAELVRVATAMINCEVGLIEGVRKHCSLSYAVGDPDNEVFLPIHAIDSETDHFPIGEVRSTCAPSYLVLYTESLPKLCTDYGVLSAGVYRPFFRG